MVFSNEVYSNFTAMSSRNLLFVHVLVDSGGKVNILEGVSVGH